MGAVLWLAPAVDSAPTWPLRMLLIKAILVKNTNLMEKRSMVRVTKLTALLITAAAVAIMMAVGAVQLSAPTVNAGVDAAVVTQAASTPVAQAVAPLGNKFVRSFKFENRTKTWLFYDPRVPQASTQRTFEKNQSYWILVTEAIQKTLAGKEQNFTCKEGNCWNQIVW